MKKTHNPKPEAQNQNTGGSAPRCPTCGYVMLMSDTVTPVRGKIAGPSKDVGVCIRCGGPIAVGDEVCAYVGADGRSRGWEHPFGCCNRGRGNAPVADTRAAVANRWETALPWEVLAHPAIVRVARIALESNRHTTSAGLALELINMEIEQLRRERAEAESVSGT